MEIQRIRREKRLSQRELASRIGVERSAVAKWETGTADPRAGLLPAIAEVLGCSIGALYEGEEATGKASGQTEERGGK